MSALGLHLPKEHRRLHGLRHISYRLDYLLDLFDALNIFVVQVFLVDDTDDVIEIVNINRKP